MTLADAARLFTMDDQGNLFRLGEPADQVRTSSTGYRYKAVSVAGQRFMSSRVVWLMTHGTEPEGEVDHRDGNPMRNCPSNLRDVSHADNQSNMRRKKRRQDLPQGVRPVSGSKNRYQAILMHKGHNLHLGNFDTPDDAHRAYIDGKRRHCGDFSPV